MRILPRILSFSMHDTYVNVSRARLNAEIYTNNAEGLGPRLSADVGKSSTVEFSQSVAPPVARDFGTGQSI
jgi:hypothetical protein